MPNSPPDQGSPGEAAEIGGAKGPSRASRLAWPFGVVAAVLFANLLPLLGVVDTNPLGPVARIALWRRGYLPGGAYTDFYVGYTSQALGHLAAIDWLHGTVPWWNPYEGLGVPLLAEMQSAAFFPPTLLLALPQGQLYFHVTLELIAGLATWFLLRELGFSRPIATVGGILFALNGTFAWLSAAPENPVAFLPVMILGIERLYRRKQFDSAGFLLLAGGLALSIYAGFPETTYFEVLFALLWFIFRCAASPSGGRLRFSGRTALGGLVGLMLSAPIVVAFLGYLSIAYLGPNLKGYIRASLQLPGVTTVGLPYLLGSIKAFDAGFPMSATWVEVGGFVTAPVLALAFVGFVGGGRERAIRWLLAGTAAILLLWSFGVPVVKTVLEHVLPRVRDVEYFRYAAPEWELAFVLLACFGVERVASREGRWRALLIAGGGLFALCVIGGELALLWKTIDGLEKSSAYHPYPVLMLIWGVGIVLAVAVAGLLSGREVSPNRRRTATSTYTSWHRGGAIVVGALLVIDAVAMFVVPELSAPRSVRIDTGPTRYLAAHLGNGRFFSIDALVPNYGSIFWLGVR